MKNINSFLSASTILFLSLLFSLRASAQVDPLIEKVAQKLALVND